MNSLSRRPRDLIFIVSVSSPSRKKKSRLHPCLRLPSVGTDLKELRRQMSKCLKFSQGIEIKADFHSKMIVCRHELGGESTLPPPTPGNSNPGPTAYLPVFTP